MDFRKPGSEAHSRHHDILRLLRRLRAVLALKESSSVCLEGQLSSRARKTGTGQRTLVHLEEGDDDVGRVDTDVDGGSVPLLAVNALDVDDPLLAVDLGDLALATLVGATNDEDLVVLANGDGPGLSGIQRTWDRQPCRSHVCLGALSRRLTLCFSRSSLLSGADMMWRRTEEGASKWALRSWRRLWETPAEGKRDGVSFAVLERVPRVTGRPSDAPAVSASDVRC